MLYQIACAQTAAEASTPRRSRKGKAKSSCIQTPVECDQLAFLSTLTAALHSEPGAHPLDSLTTAMSDQNFCDTLEDCFEAAVAADSPAMASSLRALQVLLSRLYAHWKVSAHLECGFCLQF